MLAVNAHRIKNYEVTNYDRDDMSIYFILKNAMNNILSSVMDSTSGILEDTKILAQDNKNVLMVLLITTSILLLVCTVVLLPVVTKVRKDKDKLLSLFVLIDPGDVKEQLKRCKDFFATFHNDDKHGPQNLDAGFDLDDEDDKKKKDKSSQEEEKKEEDSDGAKQQQIQKGARFTRSKKKHKKYSTGLIMLLLKLTLIISILEGYFIYGYYKSDSFLKTSLDMIKEAAAITNRSFSNFLLY